MLCDIISFGLEAGLDTLVLVMDEREGYPPGATLTVFSGENSPENALMKRDVNAFGHAFLTESVVYSASAHSLAATPLTRS